MCVHILFIHSSVDGHLGYFHLSAIVNAAAGTMGVQISLGNAAFNSSGYVPRIARSYDISIFYFLRNNHIVSHRVCAILHSHQQCTRVPVSTPSLPTLVSFYPKKKIANLMGVRRYLIVVVMKLVISHIEHLFLCLLAVSVSLKKCLLKSFAHYFKIFS